MRHAIGMALAVVAVLSGCSGGSGDVVSTEDPAAMNDTQKLIAAMSEGDTSVVEAFLAAHPEALNQPLVLGQTLLHHAVRFGEASVVEFLMQQGADPNARGADGDSVLEYADENGASRKIMDLLEPK